MIGTCDVCGADDVPVVPGDWHETGYGQGGLKCAYGCEPDTDPSAYEPWESTEGVSFEERRGR